MAEAAGARASPPHRGIPDEIAIWEILVRLPYKSVVLVRFSVVCRAWRRAISTRDFRHAHHALQPTLPLLVHYNTAGSTTTRSVDIIAFDHRAAGQLQLQPVARFEVSSNIVLLEACCDGLLVLSAHYNNSMNERRFSICNPATRQYAPLPLAYESGVQYSVFGIYPHIPTGNYRLLIYRASGLMDGQLIHGTGYEELVPENQYAGLMHGELVPDAQDGCYVLTLGSGQPPRHIGFLVAQVLKYTGNIGSVLFRGSLHWHPPLDWVKVFDTTTELFRQMRPPVVGGPSKLFEMDGMLCISHFNHAKTTIDIWVAQDYESGIWACKYRVDFLVPELTMRFGMFDCSRWAVTVSWDGEVLLLVNFGEWLLQVDIHGKLVTTFPRSSTPHHMWLKQTLVQHTFFPTLDGYVANSSPFI